MTSEQTEDLPDATDPGWETLISVGQDRALLVYPDGTIRFRHRCRAHRHHGVHERIAAPALQVGPHTPEDPAKGHTVHFDGNVTVTPSILCRDCGLHGYVRESRWIQIG